MDLQKKIALATQQLSGRFFLYKSGVGSGSEARCIAGFMAKTGIKRGDFFCCKNLIINNLIIFLIKITKNQPGDGSLFAVLLQGVGALDLCHANRLKKYRWHSTHEKRNHTLDFLQRYSLRQHHRPGSDRRTHDKRGRRRRYYRTGFDWRVYYRTGFDWRVNAFPSRMASWLA